MDIDGLTDVAMYLRKSRMDIEAETRGEGETLSKHKKILSEYAKKHKIYVRQEDIYEEVVSGERIAYRPEMQRLLENVEQGKYNAVLCVDLDRLGRGNMIDQGTIQDVFKQSKTLILTPRKVYDLSNELDEEWSEFESFMARRELKIINRRLQRGRIQSVKDGKFMGGFCPFGYSRNKENILVPNEDAHIVKMIFNWYVNGDENGEPMGSQKIARRLNELTIKTYNNRTWFPATVIKILKNEVYIGKIQWRKTFQDKKQGIYKYNDKNDWIEAPGLHEPLIDEKLFTKAQEILSRQLAPKTRELKNPLAGLIVCGGCGYKMRLQEKSNVSEENQIRMIKCVNTKCNVTSSRFEKVEDKVLKGLKEYITYLEIQEERIKENLQNDSDTQLENPYPKMIKEMEKELDELRSQEDELDTLLERKIYSIDKYVSRKSILDERIVATVKSLEQLKNSNEEFIRKTESIPKQIEIVTDVIESYLKSDLILDKNRLLRSVLNKIIYYREPRTAGFNKEFSVRLEFNDLVDII